jgi:hypothetical protein
MSTRVDSIHIFLPGGTAEGVKIVEISNWVGRAIAGPRSRFDELRKRQEFAKTGVYVLMGQSDPNDFPTIYVGEGDPVAGRLISHYKQKDFWSTAIFFVSKDDTLNKAHVQFLEARLVSLAREAKRSVLENGNVPQLPGLSEMETADVAAFLEHVLLICGLLGVSVFQQPAGLSPSAQLFYINAKGLTAVGYEGDDGFVVRAGSESPQESARATPDSIVKLRTTMLGQGVFVQDKNRYKLAQDYAFTSPSLAAAALLGRSANGRIEWKDEKGRTLKEFQEESVTDVS